MDSTKTTVHPKPPGECLLGSVYSNCDHELVDERVAKLLAAPEEAHAQHAGWHFCGYVWRGKDGLWWEQVWRYHVPVATRSNADLLALIRSVNDDYGQD